MHEMTKANLEAAFAGESQAHMRYLAFAEAAEKEGKANTARLFRAIAYAEQVHATNHLRELAGINDTKANLQGAIDGENFEVAEMYPAYDAVAKLQDESGAIRSIHYAIEAEKIHAEMYKDAKAKADAEKDAQIGKVYICPVCGYTVEGETPEKCPVCGVPRDKFKEF
ncbi:MAG: rubrerythrin family protein [Candidatus Bipolaricaulota bacterium]|nr:rubrerythrin family protein [Candidatus Bipolaricaulota bacterium]